MRGVTDTALIEVKKLTSGRFKVCPVRTGTNFVDSDAAGSEIPADQQAIVSFLCDPKSYDPRPDNVEVISTHAAYIFLAGPYAYKVKRSVRYSYLDYSTLELRRRMCLKEIKRNKRFAPEIYIDVVAINRNDEGEFAIDGQGEPVEWALRMHCFDQAGLLSRIIKKGELTEGLAGRIAQAISDYHRAAEPDRVSDGVRSIEIVINDVSGVLEKYGQQLGIDDPVTFRQDATSYLMEISHCLRMRGQRGFIRLSHGDLHSENIVVIDDRPVLFDSIEFDDTIATIDVIYDLAFLLMDLLKAGERDAANRMLNRYLCDSRSFEDIYGLRAMPLFLACRAGIRAMVGCQKAGFLEGDEQSAALQVAKDYYRAALDFLEPVAPQLIAIGGFSGTGKTTLAAALAPKLGRAPGALHLRSDIERKAMLDVPETERLEGKFYSEAMSEKVYDFLLQKTWIALRAGSAVVVDAVFSKQSERASVEEIAARLRVPFKGFWLSASKAQMVNRVSARRGDASDATPDVVEMQIERGTGPISWVPIDSSGTVTEMVADLVSHLGKS